MAEPLEESYFKWLYGQVAARRTRDPSRTYWVLFRQLFTKEFSWFIPNDDNRVEDGKDLRHEFLAETGLRDDDGLWDDLGCSFLEMLIALSRHFAFEADFTPGEWFWHMMRNLDLGDYNDFAYRTTLRQNADNYVNEVLNQVIDRSYSPSGKGGLFPLRHPRQDQRTVELWYQMSAYILERD